MPSMQLLNLHNTAKAGLGCQATPQKRKKKKIPTSKAPNHPTAARFSDAFSCSFGNFNFQTTLSSDVPPTLPQRGLSDL